MRQFLALLGSAALQMLPGRLHAAAHSGKGPVYGKPPSSSVRSTAILPGPYRDDYVPFVPPGWGCPEEYDWLGTHCEYRLRHARYYAACLPRVRPAGNAGRYRSKFYYDCPRGYSCKPHYPAVVYRAAWRPSSRLPRQLIDCVPWDTMPQQKSRRKDKARKPERDDPQNDPGAGSSAAAGVSSFSGKTSRDWQFGFAPPGPDSVRQPTNAVAAAIGRVN